MKTQTLLKSICEISGVSEAELRKPSRSRGLGDLRKVFWKIASDRTDATLEELAHMVGRMNHSTVIYGLSKFDDYYNYDIDFRRMYDSICAELNINQN